MYVFSAVSDAVTEQGVNGNTLLLFTVNGVINCRNK